MYKRNYRSRIADIKKPLLFIKGLYKILPFDPCLCTDHSQSGRFYSMVIRNGHWRNAAVGIFSPERDMTALSDNFKPKAFESAERFVFFGVGGKFCQDMATFVSAIKASWGKSIFLITLVPKVLMWNVMADFMSASASSYVSPSPTTTPSSPSGYPMYPSSSFSMTILNILDRCILIPPVIIIALRNSVVKFEAKRLSYGIFLVKEEDYV